MNPRLRFKKGGYSFQCVLKICEYMCTIILCFQCNLLTNIHVNDSSMNFKSNIYITVWRIVMNYFFFQTENDRKIKIF